jgi:predicted peptidase
MQAGRLLALSLLVAFISISGCRKHKSVAILPTDPPGTDTVSVDPTTPGNPPEDSVSLPITYNQVGIHVTVGKNVGGFYEALPPSYDSTSNKFPLLLFLHGGGELGDGSSDSLPLLLKNSLTKRLYEKTLPLTFTVNGHDFSFIIISPQFKKWPTVEDVHDVMKYALENYRVDSSRIYLSGLSMGGGVTWEYAGSKYGKSLAAIVPICGASWADSAVARQIAKNEVPAWAFHNEDDQVVTVNSTKRYARLINAENPPIPVRVTYWPTGGHDAWTKASDPEYREEGKNMYEWMLQFVRE